jgi:hypothetical protein
MDNETEFRNDGLGISVFINKRDKGDYIVRIKDNDAGEFLESSMIFKDFGDASSYAVKCVWVD